MLYTRTSTRYLWRMASITHAVERFEAEGIFPGSLGLTVRRIRQVAPDMLPIAAKGASKNAPQMQVQHLTNLLLAQGAYLPSAAPAAVEILRDLLYAGTETLTRTVDDGLPFKGAVMTQMDTPEESLWLRISALIRGAADPDMREAMRQAVGHQWALTLCVDGPFATISHRANNELETTTYGQRGLPDRALRFVTLPFRAITTAGELLQHTIERQGRSLIENAESLPGLPTPTP